MRTLHVGISTCPNDTYLFHALLEGKVEIPGIRLRIELLDVQELNERLSAGEFDVAKASYHLALHHAADLVALPTGSALGFGNGPLLLARAGAPADAPSANSRVLCPGAMTTATLLYGLFYPQSAVPEQTTFHNIMPALISGDADYGVCIHEGRFTYGDSGLELVEDLGAAWESATKSPLPLGGVFARRALGDGVIDRVQAALQQSLRYADSHREETLGTMQRFAQELAEDVIWSHVDLYVNDWTRRLGSEGQAAIEELARRAVACGALLPAGTLEVHQPIRERRLFHLVAVAEGDMNRAPEDLLSSPPERPLSPDGFVHLSFADQVPGTLAVHFVGVTRVLLLEVDRAATAGALRIEASRDGDDFPHLYRPLRPRGDTLRTWDLRRSPAGWTMPSDIAEAGSQGGVTDGVTS